MLEWNVYSYDFNHKKIVAVNIFDRLGSVDDLKRILKQPTKEEFAEEVRSLLMYRFWSRCEYEVVITEFSSHPSAELKTDYYQQIEMNWYRFIDYFWENKNELKTLIKARQ